MNDGMLDVHGPRRGPGAVLAPIGILLAFALVVTVVAAKLFRWETA